MSADCVRPSPWGFSCQLALGVSLDYFSAVSSPQCITHSPESEADFHSPHGNIMKDLKLTNQLLCCPAREQQRPLLSKAGGLGWRAEAVDTWVGLGRGHKCSPWRLILCDSQVSGGSAEDTQKPGEVSQTGMERPLGNNLTQSPMYSIRDD